VLSVCQATPAERWGGSGTLWVPSTASVSLFCSRNATSPAAGLPLMSAVPRTGSSAKWGPMREPSVSRGQSPDLHFGSAWEGLGEPGVSRGRSRQSTFRQREGSVGWAERVTGTEPPIYISAARGKCWLGRACHGDGAADLHFLRREGGGALPHLGAEGRLRGPALRDSGGLRDPGGLRDAGGRTTSQHHHDHSGLMYSVFASKM
jgi:hypothetical protein